MNDRWKPIIGEIVVGHHEAQPVYDGTIDPCEAVAKALVMLSKGTATDPAIEELRQEAVADCRATLSWLIQLKEKWTVEKNKERARLQ